jgi:repressor LexA
MTEYDECTLKRYYKDTKNKKIRLHPENDTMQDMYYDNIQIQGIAVKVLKDLI